MPPRGRHVDRRHLGVEAISKIQSMWKEKGTLALAHFLVVFLCGGGVTGGLSWPGTCYIPRANLWSSFLPHCAPCPGIAILCLYQAWPGFLSLRGKQV